LKSFEFSITQNSTTELIELPMVDVGLVVGCWKERNVTKTVKAKKINDLLSLFLLIISEMSIEIPIVILKFSLTKASKLTIM
jgi:hypothetical protein